MIVYLTVLLTCTSKDLTNDTKVKCELIGDTEIYRTIEECNKTKKVNARFTCHEVKVEKD